MFSISLVSRRLARMTRLVLATFPIRTSTFYNSKDINRYELGPHRSNAEVLIEKHPVIDVENTVAVCDGGGGALGHPVEYIRLPDREGYAGYCMYCGLRFRRKPGYKPSHKAGQPANH